MSEPIQNTGGGRAYRVHLLGDAEFCAAGVAHREGGRRAVLEWRHVRHVLAAEVGEPEGVRTIVFDLVARADGDWVAYRLDAEPGEEALQMARRIERSLAAGCSSASLKSIAADGIPTRWYPDLKSLEEENARWLEGAA